MPDNSEHFLLRGRTLPKQIVIPTVKGEMAHLRPATLDDLPLLDGMDAFYNASTITGKDRTAERAGVDAWVKRSVAWSQGLTPEESGIGDPESRRTVAWAIITDADHGDNDGTDAPAVGNVIGMIFLIDIDGWARSARIQVLLGKAFRGRGYSRDIMPRVMTYGFASEPTGLGLHRIWVAVPEKNTRSLSVYQSLGFVPSGTSRDALWDSENNKYQDLVVMDSLVDEYDPIRSLDAFGMHIIEDNPGVQEALSAREHSIAIHQKKGKVEHSSGTRPAGGLSSADSVGTGGLDGDVAGGSSANPHQPLSAHEGQDTLTGQVPDAAAAWLAPQIHAPAGDQPLQLASDTAQSGEDLNSTHDDGVSSEVSQSAHESGWPFTSDAKRPSKKAWWRSIGLKHKNN